LKILFDQGVPVPLREFLSRHEVKTAFEMGWHQLKNGLLILKAEEHFFDVLITTDKNLEYQQNLTVRKIGIIVLSTPKWPVISRDIVNVVAKVDNFVAGSFSHISVNE
jgi:hypothetical protein